MDITKDNAETIRELAESGIQSSLRKAGKKAVNDPDAVSRELTEATDVFSASDWSNLDLEDIAAAGKRIHKLATNLVYLERIRYYKRLLRECDEVLNS